MRAHRGIVWVCAGILALGIYGFVATFESDAHFGRILAAYGGIFVAGSLLWGVIFDGFRPDRYDLTGAGICLLGVTGSCMPPEEAKSVPAWAAGAMGSHRGARRRRPSQDNCDPPGWDASRRDRAARTAALEAAARRSRATRITMATRPWRPSRC